MIGILVCDSFLRLPGDWGRTRRQSNFGWGLSLAATPSLNFTHTYFLCKDCVPGHYAVMDNLGSLVQCVPCPVDTHQESDTRSPSCPTCPTGSTTNGSLGSTQCST